MTDRLPCDHPLAIHRECLAFDAGERAKLGSVLGTALRAARRQAQRALNTAMQAGAGDAATHALIGDALAARLVADALEAIDHRGIVEAQGWAAYHAELAAERPRP